MSDINAFLAALYPMTKAAEVEVIDDTPTPLEEAFYKRAALLADCGDDSWLQQFQGTPLYPNAIALEEQCLALESQDLQKRMQQEATHRDSERSWLQHDALRLQKQQLALELHKLQSSVPTGVPAEQAPVAIPAAVAEKVAEKASKKDRPSAADKRVAYRDNVRFTFAGLPAQFGATFFGGRGAALGGALGGLAASGGNIGGALAGAAGGFGGGAVGSALGQGIDYVIPGAGGLGAFAGRSIGAALGTNIALRGAREAFDKDALMAAAKHHEKKASPERRPKLASLIGAAAEKGWNQYPMKPNKAFSRTVDALKK